MTALALIGTFQTPAMADRHLDSVMMKLEPKTRMEQRCIGRAIGIVRREQKGFNPDEATPYAFADTVLSGTQLSAPGAAIRSHGQWYRLSFECRTTPDGLGIVSFAYKLGAPVPREQWAAHLLVPR